MDRAYIAVLTTGLTARNDCPHNKNTLHNKNNKGGCRELPALVAAAVVPVGRAVRVRGLLVERTADAIQSLGVALDARSRALAAVARPSRCPGGVRHHR